MTDHENRSGDTPLGRSVEEVEQEGGHTEEPSGTTGDLWENGEVALPAIVNANTSAVPAVIDSDLGRDITETGDRDGDNTQRSGAGNRPQPRSRGR